MAWTDLINNSILLIRVHFFKFFCLPLFHENNFIFSIASTAQNLFLNTVHGKKAILSGNGFHIRFSFPETKVLSIRICFFFFFPEDPCKSIHFSSCHNLLLVSAIYLTLPPRTSTSGKTVVTT